MINLQNYCKAVEIVEVDTHACPIVYIARTKMNDDIAHGFAFEENGQFVSACFAQSGSLWLCYDGNKLQLNEHVSFMLEHEHSSASVFVVKEGAKPTLLRPVSLSLSPAMDAIDSESQNWWVWLVRALGEPKSRRNYVDLWTIGFRFT